MFPILQNRLFQSLDLSRYILYNTLKSWTGGVQYDGLKYFPRFPDQKDPEYEPSKLLMVERIKPFKGNEWHYKRILYDLRIHHKGRHIAIVKNTPHNIVRLNKIKHLIKITPIRTPDGLPEDGDLSSGFLKENGEFIVSKRLKPSTERLQLTEEFQTEPSRLDSDTVINRCRNQWITAWKPLD